MKVHLQVDGSPQRVSELAREIDELGADGLFTFEGQHDVFFPLVVAAQKTHLQLMTNVAIAGPLIGTLGALYPIIHVTRMRAVVALALA